MVLDLGLSRASRACFLINLGSESKVGRRVLRGERLYYLMKEPEYVFIVQGNNEKGK